MDESKWKFECPGDGFKVEGQDKDEIMRIAKMHVKEKDFMDISDEELESSVRRD